MKLSEHLTTLSQSYLIEGNRTAVLAELKIELEKQHGIVSNANPDFYIQDQPSYTIDFARELKDTALTMKGAGGRRVFIISTDSMTREAGNALLKTIEEPSEGTHFFLILPSIRRVLPTILSRVQIVRTDQDIHKDAAEFLSLSIPKRMNMIKDMLSQLEKEDISKADIRSFIQSVILLKKEKGDYQNLEKQLDIASYAEDQSVSLKMILEFIALSV